MSELQNQTQTAPQTSHLLDVREVAALLKCSTRTVYRFADGGLMPRPTKIGALVRWHRGEIDAWISGGCKPVRRPKTSGGL